MARCYSGAMPPRQPLPTIWLLSDARNDAVLESALKRLPRGSGFVFRHYHLKPDSAGEARRWGADLAYGPGGQLAPAHSLREIARATRAAALLLSAVFPTRSHPGAKTLGSVRFRLLAARSRKPVIALGGMNARAALRLKWPRWAGIDAFLR
jgi:thiamine-phosphate pyrophosphorylase